MLLHSRIQVKPLSANRMFGARGRRTFKSAAYVEYQNEIRDQLMDAKWEFGTNQVTVEVIAGFSNRGADLDNCIKPILDTYQNIFDEFNDNKVYKIILHKEIVKKGSEFLDVKIYSNELSEL